MSKASGVNIKSKFFYGKIIAAIFGVFFLMFAYQNCGYMDDLFGDMGLVATYHDTAGSTPIAGPKIEAKAYSVKIADRHIIFSQLFQVFGTPANSSSRNASLELPIKNLFRNKILAQKETFGGPCTVYDRERYRDGSTCDTNKMEPTYLPVSRVPATSAEGYINLVVEEVLQHDYAIDNFNSHVLKMCQVLGGSCTAGDLYNDALAFQAAYELFYPGEPYDSDMDSSLQEAFDACNASGGVDGPTCLALILATSPGWTAL